MPDGSIATGGTHSPAWGAGFPAPAKLNLFLHVLGRRADGYHLIETLFRLIDLSDTLRFTPRADGEIRLASSIVGLNSGTDLCVRAARALRQAALSGPRAAGLEAGGPHGELPGVDIHLDKRIPMGGGLGGGSSDAATTLLALNRLWSLNLPRQRLVEIGLTLGADVPVFVLGRNAFAEGVGEHLTEAVLPPAWYVVLCPPVAVPTATIFASPRLTRSTKSVKIVGFSASTQGVGGNQPDSPSAWPRWAGGFGHNDLEPVAGGLYSEVRRCLAWLREHTARRWPADSATVRMSGSGGCVFAELPGGGIEDAEQAALAILADLPEGMKTRGTRGWVARGLDASPMV